MDSAVLAEDLYAWSKYSNFAMFRKSVLSELDTANFVEYDRESDTVIISPVGIKCVEENILRTPVKAVANPSRKRGAT